MAMTETTDRDAVTRELTGRIHALPMSRWHYGMIALTGSALIFDTADAGVASSAEVSIGKTFGMQPAALGLLISAAAIGAACSAALIGLLAQRFGRRRLIIGSILLFSLATAAASLAGSFTELVAIRVIAGIGYGGGCLPKDVRGLGSFARSIDAATAADLLSVVDGINSSRRDKVAELLGALLGSLEGRRVALWGAAFKPGTDDVRDSPALEVADRLYQRGADVIVYDPQATPNALVEFPHFGYADTAAAAAKDADAVLVATAWPEFASIRPSEPRSRGQLLIDACQAIDPGPWRAAGWTVAAPFPAPDHPERMVPAPRR